MQSFVALRSSLRHLFTSRTRLLPLLRSFGSSSTAAGAGDTAVHSEDPQGDDAEEAAKAEAAEEKKREEHKDEEISKPPPVTVTDNIPPFAPSPKLESHEVVPPADPTFQQKRRWSSSHVYDKSVLDEVPCVGPDGSPLGREKTSWEEDRERDLEDNKEYYAKHKASPLSEIKFVDTRKPITRATDGGASDDVGWDTGRGALVEDTVDAALARAEAIFRERAMAGDPDMPHSRVLARMLREQDRHSHGSL